MSSDEPGRWTERVWDGAAPPAAVISSASFTAHQSAPVTPADYFLIRSELSERLTRFNEGIRREEKVEKLSDPSRTNTVDFVQTFK